MYISNVFVYIDGDSKKETKVHSTRYRRLIREIKKKYTFGAILDEFC
jgi:hypothetical protein